MLFTALELRHEVASDAPSLNDTVFHYSLIQRMSEAVDNGESLIDNWSDHMEMGFPWVVYYQHLPHVLVVFLDQLFLGQMSLLTLYNLVRFLLLVTFPITVFWSMRRLGFSRLASIGGAAVAPLFSGAHRYGFEYDSYVWRGFGMYTQLFAMHLSFITLACLHQTLESGRSWMRSVLVFAALILSHFVYAYIILISAGILFLTGATRENWRPRAKRFAAVVGLAAVVTCYAWIPFVLPHVYVNASPNLAIWKYDSYGARQILEWLVTGDLFDHGRLPVLTLLGAVGVGMAVVQRSRPTVLALALLGVWLVLYFGRVTWGSLADLMPFGESLLYHRFIGGVAIAAIMLAGLGAEGIWRLVSAIPRSGAVMPVLLPSIVLTAFLMPAIAERHQYYEIDRDLQEATAELVNADTEANQIIETLKTLPPGRVYAGQRTDYGLRMKFGPVSFYDLLVWNQLEATAPPYPSLTLNADLTFDFNYTNRVHYEVFNTRYVVAPTDVVMPGFMEPLLRLTNYALYESPSGSYFALGAADVAYEGKVGQHYATSRAWFHSTRPAARIYPLVLLDGGPKPETDLPREPMPDGTQVPQTQIPNVSMPQGGLLGEEATSQRHTAVVETDRDSLLVLKVTYHPNWKAKVDGRDVETFMVMPSYVGIWLPQGQHVVVIAYEPQQSRRLLLLLGGLTILGMIAYQRRDVIEPYLRDLTSRMRERPAE